MTFFVVMSVMEDKVEKEEVRCPFSATVQDHGMCKVGDFITPFFAALKNWDGTVSKLPLNLPETLPEHPQSDERIDFLDLPVISNHRVRELSHEVRRSAIYALAVDILKVIRDPSQSWSKLNTSEAIMAMISAGEEARMNRKSAEDSNGCIIC